MKKLLKSKKGIVGIEAAIVLIAFIIVAAALSYVVINMGFYTTQKTKETMQSGLEESLAALQLDGVVTGKTNTEGHIEWVVFPVKLSAGRASIDLKNGTVVVSVYLPDSTLLNLYRGLYNKTEYGDDPVDLEAVFLSAAQSKSENINLNISDPTYNGTLTEIPVVPGSLKLNVSDGSSYYLVTDDGRGHLQSPNFTITSSSIDYSAGFFTFTLGGSSPPALTATATANYKVSSKEDFAMCIIYNDDGDSVLESTEKAFLIIHLDEEPPIGGRHTMIDYDILKVEVKGAKGAALTVVRMAPGGMLPESYIDLG